MSVFAFSASEKKYLGTPETLSVILTHRKILSECIRNMDSKRVNYVSEPFLFSQIKKHTKLVTSDTRKRIHSAFATDNLLQSHVVMDIDRGQGESRLYFQEAVIGVVRLCDTSLFKKLTDVQLKSHLNFLNQAYDQMCSGYLTYQEDDDDFIEFIDNLFMHLGQVLSNIRQNVIKMQSIGKELESITSSSVSSSSNVNDYIQAKELWLTEIVKLYERHIIPVLEFLNPDTQYAELDGLHSIVLKMRDLLQSHGQVELANNLQTYLLSFLNFYRPIEQTAQAVSRFIHKERDSIKRFNAIEHFYQIKTLPALAETQSDNLNKRLLGSSAIVLPNYACRIKQTQRPQGYAFNSSDAYYKNLFNELEARTMDLHSTFDFSEIFGVFNKNEAASKRQLRYEQLVTWLESITLRETNDLLQVVHARLENQFADYKLFDLISAVQFFKLNKSVHNRLSLVTTNKFGIATHQASSYRYRKIYCVAQPEAEAKGGL